MSPLSSYLSIVVLILSMQLGVLGTDYTGSYALEEPILRNRSYPAGLSEAELRGLSLNDIKLRTAYATLVDTAHGGPKIINDDSPEMAAVLIDLRRRGDAATPLMIDIMDKNHNTPLEYKIPLVVAQIATIKMAPYLEYLREMVRTRPDEISASASEAALAVFLDYGTDEDVNLIQDLAKKRPFLAPSVQRAFQHRERRSNDPTRRVARPDPSLPVASSPASHKPLLIEPSANEVPLNVAISSESTHLLTWSGMFLAAGGLLWWLLKGRSLHRR